ncbi:hypothetical protein NHX12_019216 [Muraenolepis orangiensis]|uniref:RRM domain-containing protein n=1 Tax=Muraenolepis orangiensis TaxID=630683 RepID=A0A9Q0ESY8_9TELE|nr:hypothetical protein NHX12_019216 [Muraenolepis orangiensis]
MLQKSAAPKKEAGPLRTREAEEVGSGGPTTTVFVGNISEKASDMLVRQLLAKCGIVLSWKRVQGASGKLQAFGFCEYKEPESTLRALRLLHELLLGDKKLLVKVDAKTKAQLDDWKAKKKSANGGTGGVAKEADEDVLDEETQRRDQVVSGAIEGLIREYASELNAPTEYGKEDINAMEMEDDKRDLISREINSPRAQALGSWQSAFRRLSARDDGIDSSRAPLSSHFLFFTWQDRIRSLVPRSHSGPTGGSVLRPAPPAGRLSSCSPMTPSRLKNWEIRERKKARDYSKETERVEERRKDTTKEAKRLKEFLEDYDDDRDDPKYYRGSALQKRLRDREKEAELDERDRKREKEEHEEIRQRLLAEGHPDPDAELQRDGKPGLKPTLRPITSAPSVSSGSGGATPNTPGDESPCGIIIPGENSPEVQPPEELRPKIGLSLKLGATNSPTQPNTAKRKKLAAVDSVFNKFGEEEPEDQPRKRKLVPLDYGDDDKSLGLDGAEIPGTKGNVNTEEKRKHIKSLIEKIPTARPELFTYPLDWSMVDSTLMDRRIRPWINKKIIEYIGEEEPTLVDFVCSKVMAHSTPQGILDDVAMVLDEEAELKVCWVLVMMDDFSSISLLSLAMLVGCYVAGTIPLAVNFSEEKLKLVTVLGAGLLCGTALAVIIPEGVHALYQEILEGAHHAAIQGHAVDPLDTKGETEAGLAVGVAAEHGHGHAPGHEALHAYIGVSLVLGFVFMLLVDQIGSSHMHSSDAQDPEAARIASSKITTTLGLVVHAAADGVALGAAASTSQTSVQLIVFVAIMLHKAPAAFGLVSFLMHAGLERNRIRKHLLVFALAAPVMAMLTFLGLSQSSKEALSDVNATGVAMLFSAGTFLYVATVHVLPEVGGTGHSHASSPSSGSKGLSKVEVVALVLGCLIPLILSVGHHH